MSCGAGCLPKALRAIKRLLLHFLRSSLCSFVLRLSLSLTFSRSLAYGTLAAANYRGSRSIFPTLRPSRVDLPRDPEVKKLQKRLRELKLSNKAIEDREIVRIAATQELLEEEARKGNREAGMILRSQTPWFVMMPYRMLCWFLGEDFKGRGDCARDSNSWSTFEVKRRTFHSGTGI